MTRQAGRYDWRAILVVGGLLLGLTGCDFWPPALQAQIEQLKADAQMAAAERNALDTQLKEALKTKDDLQARLDELKRLNRELAGNVTNLKQALDAEREKRAKMSKPGSKPGVAKSAPKSGASAAAAKKKPAKKK